MALVLVGDGASRGTNRGSSPGGGKIVFITGFVNQSQISRFYREADIFALASEWDPSPKALNEAMNFGLPLLVSSGVGTARDLVINGENGFLFPPGDIDSIRNHLTQLIAEPQLRQRMGLRSREIIEDWSYPAEVAGTLRAITAVRKSSA